MIVSNWPERAKQVLASLQATSPVLAVPPLPPAGSEAAAAIADAAAEWWRNHELGSDLDSALLAIAAAEELQLQRVRERADVARRIAREAAALLTAAPGVVPTHNLPTTAMGRYQPPGWIFAKDAAIVLVNRAPAGHPVHASKPPGGWPTIFTASAGLQPAAVLGPIVAGRVRAAYSLIEAQRHTRELLAVQMEREQKARQERETEERIRETERRMRDSGRVDRELHELRQQLAELRAEQGGGR